MFKLKKTWAALAALLLAGSFYSTAFAQTSGADCPRGFARIPSGAACAAVNLAGDNGDYPGVVEPVDPTRVCPAGFEKPVGVRVCIATRLTLNAIGELPILELNTSRFCPEGFHRPTGSSICVASNLTIVERNGELILKGSTNDCPYGFYRPSGSAICIAGNVTAPVGTPIVLGKPVGPICPKGFHRPPGVAVCIAENIVSKYVDPANPWTAGIPSGACPKGWYKPKNINFCIPKNLLVNEQPQPQEDGLVFTGQLCPAGTYESWFDMPIYDRAGLFVVDFVPTRTCIVDGYQPAG